MVRSDYCRTGRGIGPLPRPNKVGEPPENKVTKKAEMIEANESLDGVESRPSSHNDEVSQPRQAEEKA